MLLDATVVALALGETIEAIAIFAVIILNPLIGFLTEWKAEHALTALRRRLRRWCRVSVMVRTIRFRPGLVFGDAVALAAGTTVSADGRVIESVRPHVEEVALTGESQLVTKTIDLLPDGDVAVADRLNMESVGESANGRLLRRPAVINPIPTVRPRTP